MTRPEFFKITTPSGEVIYEEMAGRAPSVRVREAIAEYGEGVIVGMTAATPEARKATGMAVTVGATVEFRAYGRGYVGKVVKITPKYTHVEFTVATSGIVRVHEVKHEAVTVIAVPA